MSRPVGQEDSEDSSTEVTSRPMVALRSDRVRPQQLPLAWLLLLPPRLRCAPAGSAPLTARRHAQEGPHVTTANAHPDLSALSGGLAYITGGASGIGYGLAQESLERGLAAVVIADVEPDAMEAAVERLRAENLGSGEVFGVVVDVSDADSVAASADAVAERFPGMPISLLAANAGVGGSGSVIHSDQDQWDFVMGVNVTGVSNCLRTFVPGMLKQDGPGSIMATSSQDGICAANGIYGVSKHACTAMMEALHQELRGRLSTHLLCPNVTATNVVTSERNRARISSNKSEVAAAPAPADDEEPNPILERFQAYVSPMPLPQTTHQAQAKL